MADFFGDGGFRQQQLHRAVAGVGNVERMPGRAGQRAADVLIERPQQLQRARALGRVGDAHHDAARLHRDAAADRNLAFAHLGAHVVAQRFDLPLGHRGAVDLHENVRAALQIEAEHDGAERHEGRKAALHRRHDFPRQKARDDRQRREHDERHDGGDLPGSKTKHRD